MHPKDSHSNPRRPRILFVGALSKPIDGALGGQLSACTLLLESELGQIIDWILIDSSQKTQPPPPAWARAWPALVRLVVCLGWLIRPKTRGGLLFSSYQTFSLMEKTTICILGRLLGKRMVTTYRSEVQRLGKPDWIIHPLMSLSFRLGTRVICQSHAAAEKLIDFFPHVQPNIEIIPNWIDPSQHPVNPPHQQDTPIPKILFLGWLEDNKGAHDLLDALQRIKDKGLPFQLTLGGSGARHQALVEQANRLGLESKTDFRGWVTGQDKDDILAEANLFVLPSYSEGMPNSLLEAMTCGIPVIATSVGGIPHLVTPAGSILVAPGSPDELAVALETLLTQPDLRKKMGTANRAHVEKQHNIQTAWPKVAQLFDVSPRSTSMPKPNA